MYKYEIEIAAREQEMVQCIEEGKISLATKSDRDFVEEIFLSCLTTNGQRAFKKYYQLTVDGLKRIPREEWAPQAVRMTNPYLNTDEHICGLYFIGCVGCNPITKAYQYCVKVGKSFDIGGRMRQHASSNPLLYHNNASLPVNKNNIGEAERNCHRYLDRLAIGMPTTSNEWWFVDEDTYMNLCAQFSNRSEFQRIAKGG